MATKTQDAGSSPNIVVIGGGTGSSVVLSGLKRRGLKPTAIVTAFDSGGSSGRLRREFGHVPVGDLRRCILALADESPATEAFLQAADYRFTPGSSLNGHNLGNLFLSALVQIHGDIQVAVDKMSEMLRVSGAVVPVSLNDADLCAELADGSVLRGEATIDLRRFDPPAIRRVFLDWDVQPNTRAIDAVREADVIVLGPGDLYTSLLPNLLVHGLVDAIRESRARTVYVCNVMTKRGETDGFTPVDFVREVTAYVPGLTVDTAIFNTAPVPNVVRETYAAQNAQPVTMTPNIEQMVTAWCTESVCLPLISVVELDDQGGLIVRHDPDRLADAIVDVARNFLDDTVPDRAVPQLAD